MTPSLHRLMVAVAILTGIAACGGNSSPTAPTTVTAPSTTPTTTTTTPAPPPTVATATACATWAAAQRPSGVPDGSGTAKSDRESLFAAGGGIRVVSNRYYAMWFPSNWAATSPRRAMIGLHGTGGAPETEWNIDWKTIVAQKNWAYIALKYVDDSTGIHDQDGVIYTNLTAMLDDVSRSCDFGLPSMFLVGFSRGSAEAFPVAYRDIKDRKFFKAVGNNSGAWTVGGAMVPIMADIVARRDTNAYAGTNFWMYCGGQDSNDGVPRCTEMANARTFITSYGGHVERLYEDPPGGHGGLAKNADAWGSMLTYFESLR